MHVYTWNHPIHEKIFCDQICNGCFACPATKSKICSGVTKWGLHWALVSEGLTYMLDRSLAAIRNLPKKSRQRHYESIVIWSSEMLKTNSCIHETVPQYVSLLGSACSTNKVHTIRKRDTSTFKLSPKVNAGATSRLGVNMLILMKTTFRKKIHL